MDCKLFLNDDNPINCLSKKHEIEKKIVMSSNDDLLLLICSMISNNDSSNADYNKLLKEIRDSNNIKELSDKGYYDQEILRLGQLSRGRYIKELQQIRIERLSELIKNQDNT